MRSIVSLLLLAYLCDAKPMQSLEAPMVSTGRLGIDNYIIGGSDSQAHAWPWQLSQQRRSGTGTWSHSCGASLISANRALSAAHCVDGAATTIIRVIAGLHRRSDLTNTQQSDTQRINVHADYNVGTPSYANDIAIIHLTTHITTGPTIAFATLPPDNNNNFAGTTCTITGWGRTSSSNVLPDTLQQAPIGVITTGECATAMSGVSGANIWDGHICLFDTANNIGSCNGDSGGPLNCPSGTGGYYVAGVTSWGISNILGNCLQTYPSVYTRTGYYLHWINSN